MKSKLWVLVAGVMFGASVASASLTTLVDEGASWQYTTLTNDLWSNWNAVDYGSFDWEHANYSTAQAGFGYGGGLPANTYWAPDTDLALRTTFDLSGTLSNLMLNVASDNGFAIFVNGQQIAKDNAEGYTNKWEYTYNVGSSAFKQGINRIDVLAEDHGGWTFFDMKMTGDVAAPVVPAPGALVLGWMGLGLIGWVKKRRMA